MLEKLPEAVGEALQGRRAGLEQTVFHQLAAVKDLPRIELSSPAFPSGGRIPALYTADGDGISPPLHWQCPLVGATSSVLIVEDADSPTPHPLVHAIVVNLSANLEVLEQGAITSPHHDGEGLQAGRNSYLQQAWLPPDPPPAHGPHHYLFQVFALREGPAFSAVPGRHEIIEAVTQRALASGCLVGIYERAQRVSTEEPADIAAVPDLNVSVA